MEGKQLGDYHLTRFLGSGALGMTYLAEHRFLKRPFILKILDSELTEDRDFLNRFEQQTTLLSQLEHPHIVKIHNVSESEGCYYLVTDPVINEKGENLNLYDYLRQKDFRILEEDVIKIAQQTASALDYTHNKKGGTMTHQGLKPTNILLSKNLHQGLHIQISDFGLSKIIGPSRYMGRIYKALADKIEKTWESLPQKQISFLHHYLFLAPEQKWIQGERLDMKIDSYAFGGILYFLLTGKYLDGVFDISSQIPLHYKLPWGQIISSCLHIDPERRPPSLSKLLTDLIRGKEEETAITQIKPLLKPGELQRPESSAIGETSLLTPLHSLPHTPRDNSRKNLTEESEISPLIDMVIIQGGGYERGSNMGGKDELPRHLIFLDPYAIDIHPVTNEQFVQFLTKMGGEKDYNNNEMIRLRESRIKKISGKLSIESGYAKHPVVGVTYYGALAYAKWVGKRLPTEAEWEVASYGGFSDFLYPTGKTIDRTQANFLHSDTISVMSYPPNFYGIYDMAGNIYEWCQDWYDNHYYNISLQEPRNPKGPQQGVYRVLRGGCWKSVREDLRCSHRHRNNPGSANGTYGFRCATDARKEESS